MEYGPDSNDTVLQLRKRGIEKIILAGMSANLCTESHLREFMEQGFEVLVVTDATAAAQMPGLDGYAAAMVNVRMIANAVRTTDQTIEKIKKEL
jgi:nicotinamidase-related amidase